MVFFSEYQCKNEAKIELATLMQELINRQLVNFHKTEQFNEFTNYINNQFRNHIPRVWSLSHFAKCKEIILCMQLAMGNMKLNT